MYLHRLINNYTTVVCLTHVTLELLIIQTHLTYYICVRNDVANTEGRFHLNMALLASAASDVHPQGG